MMSEVPEAEQIALNRSFDIPAKTEPDEGTSYGLGGRLTVDKADSTRFRVFIEGRAVEFELAIVPSAEGKKSAGGPLGGEDEVEDEKRFEQGKVHFDEFMRDEYIVSETSLVLRWAGDKYVAATPRVLSALLT